MNILDESDIVAHGYHLSGISEIGEEFCTIEIGENTVNIYADELFFTINKEDILSVEVGKDNSKKQPTLLWGAAGGILGGIAGCIAGAALSAMLSECSFLHVIKLKKGSIIFEAV